MEKVSAIFKEKPPISSMPVVDTPLISPMLHALGGAGKGLQLANANMQG